jgi:hypothetical protein
VLRIIRDRSRLYAIDGVSKVIHSKLGIFDELARHPDAMKSQTNAAPYPMMPCGYQPPRVKGTNLLDRVRVLQSGSQAIAAVIIEENRGIPETTADQILRQPLHGQNLVCRVILASWLFARPV